MKPGRNDPCSCGSGRKYKQCCGQAAQADAPANAAASGLVARSEGLAHFHAGRHDDAVASFERAAALQPADAAVHSQYGDLLFALCRYDQAIVRYQRAVTLNPRLIEAHNNLGNALVQAGRLEDAIGAYRRVLALKPDSAETYSNLSKVLLDQHRFSEAIEAGTQAVRINPNLPEAHANLANALLDCDRAAEAIVSYRRALTLNERFPEAWNSLGNALRSLGDFDPALLAFQRALALNPQDAQFHNNLGVTLRLLARNDEAEACCRRSLALAPHSAGPLAALGEIHIDRGQFAQAETLLKQAVTLDPNLTEAWVSLTRLRRMTADDRAWLDAAQRLLARPLRPRERISLHYAVGKYFDDIGECEQAFDHFRRANDLGREHTRHDRARLHRETDNLIRVYSAEAMRTAGRDGNPSVRPVFIVGMPRSGTSLAEQIIASHRQAFGAGELTYWHARVEELNAAGNGTAPGADTIRRLTDEYLRLLQTQASNVARVVDKMPTNFRAIGLIHCALPNARIIHMQRNPIDTCLSIYFQDFNARISYANDFEDLADFYREYRRLMRHWRASLPPGVLLDVPYEDLVAGQEVWSRRMIDFIGLDWDERCLEFHRTERSVITASKWQVRQKINSQSVERWRRYQKHLGPLLPLLEEPD